MEFFEKLYVIHGFDAALDLKNILKKRHRIVSIERAPQSDDLKISLKPSHSAKNTLYKAVNL